MASVLRVVFCRENAAEASGFEVLLQHRKECDHEGTSRNKNHGIWDLPGGAFPSDALELDHSSAALKEKTEIRLTRFHAAVLGVDSEMGGRDVQVIKEFVDKCTRHPRYVHLEPVFKYQVGAQIPTNPQLA